MSEVRVEQFEHPMGAVHSASNELLVYGLTEKPLLAVQDIPTTDSWKANWHSGAQKLVHDLFHSRILLRASMGEGNEQTVSNVNDMYRQEKSDEYHLRFRSLAIFEGEDSLLFARYKNADAYDDWEDYFDGDKPTELDSFHQAEVRYMIGAPGLSIEKAEIATAALFTVIESKQTHLQGWLTKRFKDLAMSTYSSTRSSEEIFNQDYAFGTVPYDGLKAGLGHVPFEPVDPPRVSTWGVIEVDTPNGPQMRMVENKPPVN